MRSLIAGRRRRTLTGRGPTMGAEAIASDAAAPAEPEVIGVDQVVDLVEPLPDVNKAAIAVEHAPQPAAGPDEAPKPDEPKPAPPAAGAAQRAGTAAKPAKSAPAPVDFYGRPFDPRLHETTPDGKPVICESGKRAGKIRCRRQPLKEYTQESSIGDQVEAPAGDAAAGVQPDPAADAAAVAAQRKAAAATLTGCQVMLMRIALGPAIADEDVEREALVESWQSVLAHHDVRTFNPWLGLAIVTGGIIAAKVNKPETRSRLQRFAEWGKVKAYALWLRITGRRAAPPPPAEPKREAKPEAPAAGEA